MAMPDVFSIRHTTVEAYAEPIVHEVKVQRADLLADLRRAGKRQAYLELGGECWYVIKRRHRRRRRDPGRVRRAGRRRHRASMVARPAPKRPTRIGFALWMALARATPLDGWQLDDAQSALGAGEVDALARLGVADVAPLPPAPLD